MQQLELEIVYCLVPNLSMFQETLERLFLILRDQCRLYCNRGTLRGSWSIVVVVIYRCQLIRQCQSIVGRGRLLPFYRSWILVILVVRVITRIAAFRVVSVATNLIIPVQVPPLLSLFLQLRLAIAAATILCSYLLLLLLLYLLSLVLTTESHV